MSRPLAVVLSGGGAKGAFQVGALEELILNRGVKVDIFCGVSTGSIQALGGAQDDIEGLKEQWLSLRKNSDVYRTRPFRTLGGLFGADSIFDAAPIRKKIVAFADSKSLKKTGKKLILGVVNLQDGKFKTIHEDTKRIGEWVYASCAMPYFFQPMTDASGGQWVDGGVRNITPLSEAMKWNPRAILTIMASPVDEKPQAAKKYGNLLSISLRCVGVLTDEVYRNDFDHAGLYNQLVEARNQQAERLAAAGFTGAKFKHIMEPLDKSISEARLTKVDFVAPQDEVSDTLEFDQATIKEAMEKGREAIKKDWKRIEDLIA